ncbi:DUF4303 domain-containing protein [Acidovorax sp. LjRoot129]|uniref:DUF4303 domain-containing protein n=1 Tax=Acidovorax sp. LjRoot129 TaxID=3342260 RepID=UPI003ECCBE1D
MYPLLESTLERAAFEAFRRLAEAHASDHIYCAALFTSSGYNYVCDTANTKKGLHDLAEASIARGLHTDLASATDAYKWSPCDWPFHLANESLFDRPNELLEQIWQTARGASEEDSDRAYIAIHEVFISVLRKIRQSGLVSDDCLVTLLAGDQSDEARVANAEKINPPDLVAKFIPDFRVEANYLARLRTDRWQQGEDFEP